MVFYYHKDEPGILLSDIDIRQKNPNTSFPADQNGRLVLTSTSYREAPPAPAYDPETQSPPIWIKDTWVVPGLSDKELVEKERDRRIRAWSDILTKQKEKLRDTDFYELPSAAERYTEDSILDMLVWRDSVRTIDHTFNYPDGNPYDVVWPPMPSMKKKE